MKRNLLTIKVLAPLIVALLSLVSVKADVFFSDTFGGGSTLNQTPTTNKTTTATSYQSAVGLTGSSASIAAGSLVLTFPSTTSVLGEVMGLFTNSPLALSQVGDTIAITVVFTNTANIFSGSASANSSLNIGLFNSGGVPPNQGNIVLSTGNTTGGSQNWIGYASRIFTNGNANIFTRAAQTANGTTSQNQDLLFTAASGSQSFNNPSGTGLGNTAGAVTLAPGGTYTLYFSVTLTNAAGIVITNTLYSGAGTGGSVLFTQNRAANGANLLTTAFNGFAIGWRNSSSPAQASTMTISSITVSGNISAVAPPTIVAQPEAVTVATGGACMFSVQAAGAGLTYQWVRNGTNLLNAGNISGATSSMLVITNASVADVASGANGYRVIVTSPGGSVTSTTNSLTLVAPRSLVWSGSGNIWSLTNVSWIDPVNPSTFNYGDSVTFNDTGSANATVTLAHNYLTASQWRITGNTIYAFTGSGSVAGPGSLLYDANVMVQMNVTNAFSGGTTISNASAYLYLQAYQALGTGPLTLAKAGGKMEVIPSGSATVGIPGDINVQDDFTIQFDGTGSFACVVLGNFAGTTGKTLTLTPQNTSATNRFRVYGINTVCDANIQVDGNASSQATYDGTVFAPYQPSGAQVYNGVISGNGGLIQRGGGITVLNAANTYAGGTFPTTGIIGIGNDAAFGTGFLNIAPELPNATGSGTIYASGGARTIANVIQYPSATNNQTLVIGGTNNITFTSGFSLAGADGSSTSNRTFTANNSGATTFSGIIGDGGNAIGLVKNGTNTLYLNGANTYSGLTTVSAGRLAGSGSINGSVLVTTNAAIAGGAASGIGTLSIAGNLNLTNGGGFFRVNRSGSASDLVSVTGGITNVGNGLITVSNLGTTLQSGDTFTLFNKAMTGGGSLTVTGGLTAGLTWTNKLAANGTIQVIQSFATYSTNISYTVSGSTLTISWPATHQGWFLQAQTNSLNAGLGTNWVTIPGTDTVTSTNLTVVPGNPSVFYRLKMP